MVCVCVGGGGGGSYFAYIDLIPSLLCKYAFFSLFLQFGCVFFGVFFFASLFAYCCCLCVWWGCCLLVFCFFVCCSCLFVCVCVFCGVCFSFCCCCCSGGQGVGLWQVSASVEIVQWNNQGTILGGSDLSLCFSSVVSVLLLLSLSSECTHKNVSNVFCLFLSCCCCFFFFFFFFLGGGGGGCFVLLLLLWIFLPNHVHQKI